MRGFPGACQAASIAERGMVWVAMWSLALLAALKTLATELSSVGNGTLLTPLPMS